MKRQAAGIVASTRVSKENNRKEYREYRDYFYGFFRRTEQVFGVFHGRKIVGASMAIPYTTFQKNGGFNTMHISAILRERNISEKGLNYLGSLGVREEHRGHSLAKKMLVAKMRSVIESGSTHLIAGVINPRLVDALEKLGFEKLGIAPSARPETIMYHGNAGKVLEELEKE